MGTNFDKETFDRRHIDNEIKRAEREVFLKQKENVISLGDDAEKNINLLWDGALLVYKEIIKTGPNSDILMSYINALDSGLPLTPIIDDEKDWASIASFKEDVIKKEYCKRYPKLFRETYKNGKTVYRDNERVKNVDYIFGSVWSFGLCNLVYDEMFPIELPYEAGSEDVKIYTYTFLSNRDDKESDFDTAALLYVEKENGEQIPVNRYFRVANKDEEPDVGNWVEIDVKELEERIKASKSNLELVDLCYKLGDDIIVCPDGKLIEEEK